MPGPRPDSPRWPILAVAAATLAAAASRFVRLDFQSLWMDEYLWTLSSSLRSVASIIRLNDGYPPTVALMFRALTRWGLDSDWWLRAPSALAGTLAVPLVYLVGRRFLGAGSAAVAAWLLALHPLAIWYSQEAGAYSMAMLAALLSTLCLLRLQEGAGKGASFGYAVSSAAGFGLHYYYLFVLLAQTPFVLLDAWRRPERRRAWLLTALLTAVAVGAWIPLFLGDVRGQTEFDQGRPFPFLALPYVAQTFAGGFAIGPSVRAMHPAVRAGGTPWREITGDLILPTCAVLILLALSLLALPNRMQGRRPLLLCLGLVPVLGPWLNSLLGVGYRPRYALSALPFALLFFAASRESGRRRPAALLLLALAAIEITGWVRSTAPEHRREDTRAAAEVVAASGGGDAVLIGEGAEPFRRYARQVDRLVELDGPDTKSAATLEPKLLPLLEGRGDLFLVSSRTWTEDPDDRVLTFLTGRLPLRDTRELPGVTVRRFGRASG